MRKLFLLIPAMLLTIAAYAAEIEVAPGSNAIATAVAAADANDVLVLSTGTYTESSSFSINKNITIQAAENAHPVIAQRYYFKIESGAAVTFKGVKFDGGAYGETGASDHCLRAHDSSNGTETLTLEDCEFTRFPNYIIYTQNDTRRWDAITIRNCYFHHNTKSAVFITYSGDHQSCNSLAIENSTFAGFTGNSDYGVIYYGAPDGEHTTSLNVNHCTFYNNLLSAIQWKKSTNLTVTNSIFAQPEAVSTKSVDCAGGSITNCLWYKTDGFDSDAMCSGNITGNPYFLNTNPENYDFSLWTTSPARNAGTDDKNLGDYLRWNTDPATHVATVNITAEATNSLKAAVDAALPGDEIILAAGTYEESESISLDKEITIKAAEGAHPIVKPVGNFAISNAADITIENIKFDGTSHTASNFIYADDATNNSLSVAGCEFYNFSHAIISAADSKLIGTCAVNNCQFYNNTHSCIGLKNTAAANLTVSNSTFKNNDASGVGDGNGIGIVESKTATGTVLVNHCTFYNCKVLNTDFGITRVASPSATVSNCIFAMPTSTGSLRTVYIPSGLEAGTTVTNCIMHNFTHDSNIGVPSRTGATISNCNAVDPLFTDAANGVFSFPCNWSTGAFSPALGASTDGSDLGDPRWYSAETLPSSDFASAYDLLPTKARYAGTVEKNASNKIHFTNSSTVTDGEVKWKLNVTKTCHVSVLVDVETNCTSGRQLTLTVKDAEGNTVATLSQASATYDDADIDLGRIDFSETGKYTFILTNSLPNSGVVLEKITLAYMGGEVQTIAADVNTTLPLGEAWYSACTRADGGISFPSSSTSSAWMKWNAEASATKYYDVTVNITAANGHAIGVYIYEDGDPEPGTPTIKESHSEVTGDLALELGRVNLIGDKKYIVMVKNATSGSTAKVTGITLAPILTTVTELPGTINFNNAVLSEKAFIQDGMLYFNEIGDTDPLGQWAQWEVTTDHDGLFLFTMGVTSTNEQSYKITIKDDGNNVLDYYETSPGSGDKTIKHYFALETGSYFVKAENTRSFSKGHLTSLVVTEPDDVVTIDEAATSNESWFGYIEAATTHDVQIIRTVKAGMNNTFCLPFAVSSSQCKDIFGSDVQLRTLNEATVDENAVLTLDFKTASDIYQGTPVLIKTSRDIVNPVFTGVKFAIAAPSGTPKTNANFTGTFVKTTIEANENILYLGANNKLFFPTATIDMYGMRGWFVIHGSGGSPAPAVRSARIVEDEQVATDIEIVRQEPIAKNQKLILNGQLYILYEGQMYNVQGLRVK